MRALQRLMAIVEAVAEDDVPPSATAVAERVGLSLSTTARLMRDLEHEGLLDRVSVNGPVVLGSRLLALAGKAMQPLDVLDAALPVMHELRDLTGETVSLHVRRHHLRLCVAQVESKLQIRRVMPIGFISALHGSATSEVLLAGLNPDELSTYFGEAGIAQAERRLIERRLKEIRRDGWALTVDTVEQGLSGTAATVRDGDHTVAALSVSGPSARWTVSIMRGFAPDVVSAADRISKQIAGHHNNRHYANLHQP